MTTVFDTLFVLALAVPPLVLAVCVIGVAASSILERAPLGRRFHTHHAGTR